MIKKLHILFFVAICGALQAQDSGIVTKISRNSEATIKDYFDASLAPFYHGVASGDPLKDAVIIWTRVTTNNAAVNVKWKVATDAEMVNVIKEGATITNEDKDYTVKIDVRELTPNTSYYYQFEVLERKSPIGKTRTSPTGNVDNVRFGIVSCSNYQNGYFNAYQELSKRTDIDAVIHLGDYIYEYESGGYGYKKELGRGHLPSNEIITLSDYRIRYSYYRLDPMLREIHQQHPFILIWDDHEFSNDANKYGAENHSPEKEGSWEVRKNNAYKAYFEWQPVRANSIEEYRLYRDFSYGNLADLIMLDTRIEGREENIETPENKSVSHKKLKSRVAGIVKTNPLENRLQIKKALVEVMPYFIQKNKLTKEEQQFVLEGFTDLVYNYKTTGLRRASKTKAKQERLEMLLQKSVKVNEASRKASSYKSILGKPQFDWLLNKLSSSSATWKIIGNQVMMMKYTGVPTKDAWDGYSEERDRIHEYIQKNNINNVVVITGDIHSTFAGDINYNNSCIASEFVAPSVTSQNLDFLGSFVAGIAESYTKMLNPHMKEVDLDPHGYFVLDVKKDKVQADWYYMNDVTKPNTGQYFYKGYYVENGNCGIVESKQPSKKSKRVNYGAGADNLRKQKNKVESSLVLLGMYPNPMSEQGNIHYIIQKPETLQITIFNSRGQKVKTILNSKKHEKGIYNVSFNINDLSAGNYFISIDFGKEKITKQILVKK